MNEARKDGKNAAIDVMTVEVGLLLGVVREKETTLLVLFLGGVRGVGSSMLCN